MLSGMRWPRLPWPRILIVTTLLVATAILVYLFSVRAVQFDVAPAHAEVNVTGVPAPRIGGRWLMLAGEHRILARAEGYRVLDQRIRITGEPHQTHALVLVPLPGKLDVTVTPPLKAEILIDGVAAGSAPGLIEEVEAGLREIVVRAPRYLDFITRMEIAGKGQTQALTATLLPAWAELSIASEPAGARVLNGRDVLGVTPLRAELIQGSRQLTVELKGYKPWSRRIEVVAGQAVNIPDVRLQKDDGYFLVTSEPTGAAITVDGVFKGETPVRFAVTPDRAHVLAAMKTGFLPARLRHKVGSGDELEIPITLAPELAAVEFVTTPADAELLVDGVARGSASQRLELPTHEHEIIVRKPGFATYRTELTPRKGVIKRVQIRLKTAAEMAALPSPSPQRPPTSATPAAGTGSMAPRSAPTPGTSSALPPQWSAEAQRNADLMMAELMRSGPATSAQGLPAPGRRYTYEGRILGVDCTDWTVQEIRDNGDVISRCGEYTLQTSAAHDHNALRMVRDNGDIEIEFEPHAQALRLPLTVGKRWSGNYRVSMRELGESLEARAECTVEGEGPVEVPAGTIPAFRIACADHVRVGTRRVVSRSTRWYAPSLGIFIKGVNAEDPGRWNFALTGLGDAEGVAPWQGATPASGPVSQASTPAPAPQQAALSAVPSEGGIVQSSLGQELRLMPRAEFRMGRTQVTLARPYYLGLREVSNAEYRRFNSAHASRGAEGQDLDGEHLPVVNLSWEAAAAYCNWLSRRESLPPFYQIRFGRVIGINPQAVGYRLPTEAEWDFAARIPPEGEAQDFAWLGAFPPRGRTGNYADESAQGFLARVITGYQDGFAAAAPVGSFPPNLRGLHDLAGNVSEWIHDFHAELPAGGLRDPLGPVDGRSHVVRGSSWAHAGTLELRLDYRAAADSPRRDLGFRLARYAE
jgi:formylglycine-generating enzyme required for sulfatase activity